jgi:hypothetical protein
LGLGGKFLRVVFTYSVDASLPCGEPGSFVKRLRYSDKLDVCTTSLN